MIKQYVDTGKARLVSRQYPLNSIHAYAQKAAEAAVCAGWQGKYWEMHDKLFASQAEWTAAEDDPSSLFKQYAGELGLDASAFDQCLDKGEAAVEVQADTMTAESLGLQGTPSFMLNDEQYPWGAPMDIETLGLFVDHVVSVGRLPSIAPSGDFHVLGSEQTAQGAMAAFLDYASPDSASYALEVFPQIRSTYVDTGSLIYIFHPWSKEVDSASFQGAAAAECAGEQGKFWEMQNQLFKDQKSWTSAATPRSVLVSYAQTLGLDTAKYETCLDSDWAKVRVKVGPLIGEMYGVSASPQYLFSSGETLTATATLDQFKTTIDAMVGQ